MVSFLLRYFYVRKRLYAILLFATSIVAAFRAWNDCRLVARKDLLTTVNKLSHATTDQPQANFHSAAVPQVKQRLMFTLSTTSDRVLITGYSEQHQLLRYLSNSRQIDSHRLPFYDGHNVKVTSVNITTIAGLPAAIISLKDNVTVSLSATRMRGGNSFRSKLIGHSHRQICSYVDHADDTYDVICRLYNACADVSIHVTYVDYGAYRWDGVFVDKLVWSDKVCVNKMGMKKPSETLWSWTNTSRTYYAGWFFLEGARRRQGVQWLSSSGQQLPTDQQMKTCLDALPSPIEFIGESHLRYAYNDLIRRINDNVKNLTLGKLKTRFGIDKYVFTYGGYAVDHSTDLALLSDPRGVLSRFKVFTNKTWTLRTNPQNVQTELGKWAEREKERASTNTSLSSTLRRRLIISFGTWDTHNINIKYFVAKALPMIRQFFELRRSDTALSRVKVVITTIPAVPEHMYMDSTHPGEHSGLRNNALLAAANRLLVDTVQQFADVSVVDWFSMSVVYTEQARDQYHYVWEQNPLLLSPTGVAMMRHLIQAVCQE